MTAMHALLMAIAVLFGITSVTLGVRSEIRHARQRRHDRGLFDSIYPAYPVNTVTADESADLAASPPATYTAPQSESESTR